MINIDEILDIVASEIKILVNDNQDFYDGYEIKLTNEQKFDIDLDIDNRKTIYIVLSFKTGSLPYGQCVIPCDFNVLCERNSIEVAQKLLFDFSQEYNLKLVELEDDNSTTLRQFYTTPSLSSSFNEEGDGFRSVYLMQASFLITENILNITKIEYELDDGSLYEIKYTKFIPSYQAQVDAQAFVVNNSKCTSVGMIGTIAFSISGYLTNDELYTKCLNIMLGDGSVNQEFKFKFTFSNGSETELTTYRLVDFTPTFALGEIPVYALSFSR